MPIIAKIKPNSFTFNNINDTDMTAKNLITYLSPYIELVSIANEEEKFMEDIAKIINDVTDTHDPITIQSYKCYDSPTDMIYLVTCDLKNQQQNTLCRYINECFNEISGNCILFKMDVSNNDVVKSNITINNIIDVYLSKLIHTAVMITPDNSLSTLNFSRIPIENSPIMEDNCRCVHIEFLGKTVVMFIELKPKDNRINTYATIIGKKQKIMGTVVIALISQISTVETCNLNDELLHKILIVMSNHSISRELDMKDNFDPNKYNFYKILDERYKKCSCNICENIPPDVLGGYTYNSTLS